MTAELLAWYADAKRDLPWRRTVDPYAVWVSEAMLQQTQVVTALPYYIRWMERFPDAVSLAEATEEEALSMWQGLGYYRRCRMLQDGVRRAVKDGWPSDFAEWRAMPGVGDYTAAALASICLGHAVPVVDGNVERVYARVCASPATGGRRRAAARAWATEHISHEHPADFNQALMELGATVCKPVNPLCGNCPVASECSAFSSGTVGTYPVANPRREPVDVEWPVLVMIREGSVALVRAQEGEWWNQMYRFPRCEEVGMHGDHVGSVSHTVTHHRVRFQVYVRADQSGEPISSIVWCPISQIESLPIPSAMRKVWKLALQTISKTVLMGGD